MRKGSPPRLLSKKCMDYCGSLGIRDKWWDSQVLRGLSLGEWNCLYKTKAMDVSFHVSVWRVSIKLWEKMGWRQPVNPGALNSTFEAVRALMMKAWELTLQRGKRGPGYYLLKHYCCLAVTEVPTWCRGYGPSHSRKAYLKNPDLEKKTNQGITNCI